MATLHHRVPGVRATTLNVDGRTLNVLRGLNSKYTGADGEEFEFRVGKFEDRRFMPGVSREQWTSLLETFKERSTYTHETSTVYTYTNGYREVRYTDRRAVVQKKSVLAPPVNVSGIGRFSLSQETNVDTIPSSEKFTGKRTRDRYAFKYNTYTVELTHVTNKDLYEVEVEYTRGLDVKSLFEPVKVIMGAMEKQNIGQNIDGKQSTRNAYGLPREEHGARGALRLTHIPKEQAEVRRSLEEFMVGRGVRFNDAVNMKRKYFENLGEYIITPKWDGVRMLLYIFQGKGYLVNRTQVRVPSERAPVEDGSAAPFTVPKELDKTVLDGEFFEGTGKYIAFDVLFLEGDDMRKQPRIARQLALEQMQSQYRLPVDLAEVGYGASLYSSFNKYVTHDASLDGVVFAPRTSAYYNKQTLKYKPIELLTIDFLITVAAKLPGAEGGSDRTDRKYPRYNLYVQGDRGVEPFEPVPYIQRVDDEGKRMIGNGGVIVECQWSGDTFVPMRVRGDKTKPNYKTVAADIWEDINNPITEAEMAEVLRQISNKFRILDPFEGQPFVNVGSPDTMIASGVGMLQSMQRAVAYATVPKFQKMRETDRVRVVNGMAASIPQLFTETQKNIVVYDFYGGNAIYETPAKFSETVVLTYIVGPVYYSVAHLVNDGALPSSTGARSEGACTVFRRLFPGNSDLAVAKHYNELERGPRAESAVLGLRQYNNWVKAMLINKYVGKGAAVLDIGSGRGGDLAKWAHRRISHLTSVDIAAKSLAEAKRRYDVAKYVFGADWVNSNAYTSVIDTGRQYGIVSAQFSLHYAFKTQKNLDTAFENISRHLETGGRFIATIPNAAELIARVHQYGPEFGNEFYAVKFLQDPELRGAAYTFTLTDSVDQCPEYVLDSVSMAEAARRHGLEMESAQSFAAFAEENMDAGLAHKMGVAKLTLPEQEVAGLYMVAVFRKT